VGGSSLGISGVHCFVLCSGLVTAFYHTAKKHFNFLAT
jgi:sulfite exporter TauE/SafE